MAVDLDRSRNHFGVEINFNFWDGPTVDARDLPLECDDVGRGVVIRDAFSESASEREIGELVLLIGGTEVEVEASKKYLRGMESDDEGERRLEALASRSSLDPDVAFFIDDDEEDAESEASIGCGRESSSSPALLSKLRLGRSRMDSDYNDEGFGCGKTHAFEPCSSTSGSGSESEVFVNVSSGTSTESEPGVVVVSNKKETSGSARQRQRRKERVTLSASAVAFVPQAQALVPVCRAEKTKMVTASGAKAQIQRHPGHLNPTSRPFSPKSKHLPRLIKTAPAPHSIPIVPSNLPPRPPPLPSGPDVPLNTGTAQCQWKPKQEFVRRSGGVDMAQRQKRTLNAKASEFLLPSKHHADANAVAGPSKPRLSVAGASVQQKRDSERCLGMSASSSESQQASRCGVGLVESSKVGVSPSSGDQAEPREDENDMGVLVSSLGTQHADVDVSDAAVPWIYQPQSKVLPAPSAGLGGGAPPAQEQASRETLVQVEIGKKMRLALWPWVPLESDPRVEPGFGFEGDGEYGGDGMGEDDVDDWDGIGEDEPTVTCDANVEDWNEAYEPGHECIGKDVVEEGGGAPENANAQSTTNTKTKKKRKRSRKKKEHYLAEALVEAFWTFEGMKVLEEMVREVGNMEEVERPGWMDYLDCLNYLDAEIYG